MHFFLLKISFKFIAISCLIGQKHLFGEFIRDLKKNPLRIGILGCGSFILRRIFPILKEVDTISVVCIQNRDQKKANNLNFGFLSHSKLEQFTIEKQVFPLNISNGFPKKKQLFYAVV